MNNTGSSEDKDKNLIDQERLLAERVWLAGMATAHSHLPLVGFLAEQTDLNRALSFVQHHTLAEQQMSLYDLSNLMLGLSRLILDESLMLNNIVNRQQSDIKHTAGLTVDSSNRERIEEDQSLRNSLCDEAKESQLVPRCKVVPVEMSKGGDKLKWSRKRKLKYDEETKLNQVVGQVEDALVVRPKVVPSFGMVTAKQMRLHRQSLYLMQRPVRVLSPKLAYLFARNANVNKNKQDKHRSLTCDNSGGKRARLVGGGQYDKHHLSVCSTEQLSWSYHWPDHGQISGGDHRPLHELLQYACLPEAARWRKHLPAHCTSDSSGKTVQSDEARATASIKSIMLDHGEHWIALHHQRQASHRDVCWQADRGTSTLAPLLPLITSSCGGVRTFEVEHLTRLASRGTPVTKQLIASHFAELLELADEGAIQITHSLVKDAPDFLRTPTIYFSSK